MLNREIIDQVSVALQQSERPLLITHEHPDGDALGTTLALGAALRQLGKDVTLTCVDDPPQPFRFLPGLVELRKDCILGSFDTIVIIDCGDLKRTGMPERVRQIARRQRRIINIDHHQRNDLHKLAGINYVDYSASSAAELTLPLVKQLGAKLTPEIATNLLTGLYNDTGGFKHSNTTARVLEQAAELMSAGANLGTICANIANFRSVPALKLWGIALSRIHYHPELRLVSTVITQEDFRAADAYQEDLAGCVNLINSVPNARAALLVYEQPNGRIKTSVRTECDEVNVAALASIFGGGGIKKAAGFSFRGQLSWDGSWRILNSDFEAQRVISLPLELRELKQIPVSA